MKTLLLSAAALLAVTFSNAQCDQLFISEYTVGSGNDKGYELYNPTSEDINLDGYVLQRWSNGAGTSTDETILVGTIPAYGTWVVVNGQTDDIDIGGGVISPACSPELQALADQLDNPYPAPTYMNGNDALILVLNESTICDIFGKPGQDPGNAWNAPDGTPVTDSQTMVRKSDVLEGVTVPPITFLPMAQYDTLGLNNWTNLGIHECECDPAFGVGVNDLEAVNVSIYPNPVANNELVNITANYVVEKVEIFDITGKIVKTIELENATENPSIDISDIQNGAYIFNVYMTNKISFSTRLIKQ